MITQEDVKEWFTYTDGKLYWKKRPHIRARVRAGDRAGSKTSRNYWQIRFKDKTCKEHHLIWLMFKGNYPKLIDHKNKDTLDNRIENLREATPSQSRCNTKVHKSNISGFKGVSERGVNRYRASIKFEGTKYDLGMFKTPEEAHKAYCKKAKELHGEFFHP